LLHTNMGYFIFFNFNRLEIVYIPCISHALLSPGSYRPPG
jgi:hypothetical protein